MSSKTYTATQTAQLLGVTVQCACSLLKRNRIKAERNGNNWKILPESIINYANLRIEELNQEEKELKKTIKLLQ